MPTILCTNLTKSYKTSSPFSRAFLLALSFLTFLLIVPFILAYVSTNLWIQHDVYMERPAYTYKQCVVYAKSRLGDRTGDYFRTVKTSEFDRYMSRDMGLTLETSAPGVDDTKFRFELSGVVDAGMIVESMRIVLEFDLFLEVSLLAQSYFLGQVFIHDRDACSD
jgi:hypothetical protein